MAEVHILLETKRVLQYDVINICGTIEDAMAVDIQFFFPNKTDFMISTAFTVTSTFYLLSFDITP